MQCFSFTEQAVPYLRGVFDEHGNPVIPTPEGCSMPIQLGSVFTEMLTASARAIPGVRGFKVGYIPRRVVPHLSPRQRRVGVGITMPPQMDAMVLTTPGHRVRQEQALVRVETAAGVGGKVRLTSCAFDGAMKAGRVVDTYHAFPPTGVTALCTPDMLERIRGGVDYLDVFVLMNPGARFRIERSGALEGAKKYITVCWTGDDLRPSAPSYADLGGAGDFATA